MNDSISHCTVYVGMCLYESVSCVCVSLSDEPVLFCIYVCENVVLFLFGWPYGR